MILSVAQLYAIRFTEVNDVFEYLESQSAVVHILVAYICFLDPIR
jgi:uncharacterized membrane protein (DUF441 family)